MSAQKPFPAGDSQPSPATQVKPASLFRLLPIAAATALFLGLLSIPQKLAIGADPWSLQGFIVPVLFGGGAGFTVGFLVLRSQRELRNRLADRDVSARKLAASEEKFRLLAENSRDAIFRWSLTEHRYEYISLAIYDLTGYHPSDFYARPGLFAELLHPEDRDEFLAMGAGIARGDLPTFWEYRLQHRDGRTLQINQRHVVGADATGRPTVVEGIATDITSIRRTRREKEDLRDQLRHSQKLGALGSLTGGVAHDFNNLLTVINGYAEMILQDLPPGAPGRTEVQEIGKAGRRAAMLTGRLLAFSRKDRNQLAQTDLAAALGEALTLLERLLGEDIELVTGVAESLPPIAMATGELEQILVNLAVNAREAMHDGGTLTVEVTEATFTGDKCPLCGKARRGSYVRMGVTDTGRGMAPQVAERIFDPFFTTKQSGEGTGLGLSTVFGILHEKEGHITVDSTPGQGTTFEVLIPAADKGVAANPVATEVTSDSLRGSETILLVEDEEQIRRLTANILRQYGYRVIAANDGPAALATYVDHDGGIDLLLTDVIMPGMNGRELYEELSVDRPDLKVLFMSGYAGSALGPEHEALRQGRFLQKPFGADAIARAVRLSLDE